jgi:TrmH RNA methyltransferase
MERGELVYGFRASEAALSKRTASVHEVLVDYSQFEPAWRRAFDALRRMLPAHIRITETTSAMLQRLTESANHEGIAVRTAPRPWVSVKDLKRLLVEGKLTAIALDRVRNPYNIGAILRSAAFFGVDVVILGAPAPHPALPPDAVRVAEGGAEHVRLARTTDLAETLAQLRSVGVKVLGAENDGAEVAFSFPFPRPSVLVLGHEREGLSDRVKANCDHMVAIRGTGAIQSLNVAIAASLLIGELTRAR